MITGTVAAVLWMFATFASASDLVDLKVDVWYGQYYEILDKQERAAAEDKSDLAKELGRRLEKLRARICKEDPDWERCD